MARRESRWLKTHYLYACRRLDEDNGKTTDNPSKVTCKRCLWRIKQFNLQGRRNFRDTPIFDVRIIEEFDNHTVIGFNCPVCGNLNTHNRGDLPGDGNGHRSSPCGCWDNGYYIREIGSIRGVEGTSEIPEEPNQVSLIAVRTEIVEQLKSFAGIYDKGPGDLLEHVFSEWVRRQLHSLGEMGFGPDHGEPEEIVSLFLEISDKTRHLLEQAATRHNLTLGAVIERIVKKRIEVVEHTKLPNSPIYDA